jgi:hypothetical protein
MACTPIDDVWLTAVSSASMATLSNKVGALSVS